MAKRLNEASVKMDITDFNTSDFSTLSRMLELAAQANEDSNLPMDIGAPVITSPETGIEQTSVEMEPVSDIAQPDMISIDDTTDTYPDEDYFMNEDINRILELSGIKLNESEDEDTDSEELTETDETLDDEEADDSFASSPAFTKLLSQFQAARENYLQQADSISDGSDDLEEGSFSGALSGAAKGAMSGAKLGGEAGMMVGGPEGAVAGGVTGAAVGGIAGGIDGYNSEPGLDEEFLDIPDTEAEFEVPEEIEIIEPGFEDEDERLISLGNPERSMDQGPMSINDLFRESIDAINEAFYDFNLDEDQTNELSSLGIGDNRLFGPYPSEQAAIVDAQKEMPGSMKDVEFIVLTKPDGIFWQKKLQEDVSNSRPNPEDVDPQDFTGDKHSNEDKEMEKPGDNGLEDPRDALAENISKRFKQFMKK